MIMLGTYLYGIGFGMYGFISTILMFFITMDIITIGKMIISPVAQIIVVRFTSDDKAGRFMVVNDLAWMIPSLFGIILVGLRRENMKANWVWYFGGIFMLISVRNCLLLIPMASARLNSVDK